ncbi:MAG: carboxypeptidase-like regulatory domain-containing protein [Bryobacteraceae bacterium]
MTRSSVSKLAIGLYCFVLAFGLQAAPVRRQNMYGKILGVHPSDRVIVRIEGPVKRTATLCSDATWQSLQLPEGNYVVTPQNDKYTFTPPSRTIRLFDQDARYVDFNARREGVTTTSQSTTQTRLSVRGHISGLDANHRATVRVEGRTFNRYATTTADGSFEVRNLPLGYYRVRPERYDCVFIPAYRSVNLKDGDVERLEFQARRKSSR